jgi:hypothetical protein
VAYCEKCGNIVAERDIVPICVSRQTMNEPAEYREFCRECVGPSAEWLAEQRANRIYKERTGSEL